VTDPAAASFELLVPADAAFLETARLFAGAVARELGVDEDLVDDAKLGLSEACLVAGGDGGSLRIRASLDGNGVRFRVEPDAPPTGPSADGEPSLQEAAEPDLAEALLRGLFPDVRLDGGGAGRSISFVVPVGGPEPG
jgi:anti-sigma regulatory factor (Ser/Thr protein kinase)